MLSSSPLDIFTLIAFQKQMSSALCESNSTTACQNEGKAASSASILDLDSLNNEPIILARFLPLHGAAPNRKVAEQLIASSIDPEKGVEKQKESDEKDGDLVQTDPEVNDADVTAAAAVLVNGKAPTGPIMLIDPSKDKVYVAGHGVVTPYPNHRHVILHKPAGCVTSAAGTDGQEKYFPPSKGGPAILDTRPSVYDFLDEESKARHVMAVGRLDEDTTGLLLFTSNGLLGRQLAEPKYKKPKVYHAWLRGPEPLSQEGIDLLAKGFTLPGKKAAFAQGIVRNIGTSNADDTQVVTETKTPQRDQKSKKDNRGFQASDLPQAKVEVTITGGAYHQVKQMLREAGRPVTKLHRTEFAGLKLGDLPEGQCRPLTQEEIASLYESTQDGSA